MCVSAEIHHTLDIVGKNTGIPWLWLCISVISSRCVTCDNSCESYRQWVLWWDYCHTLCETRGKATQVVRWHITWQITWSDRTTPNLCRTLDDTAADGCFVYLLIISISNMLTGAIASSTINPPISQNSCRSKSCDWRQVACNPLPSQSHLCSYSYHSNISLHWSHCVRTSSSWKGR